MGKTVEQAAKAKNTQQRQKSINHRKIKIYINKLRASPSLVLTKAEFLFRVHKYIKSLKGTDLSAAYLYARVCKKCGNWRKRQGLVECDICEDPYHPECLQDSKKGESSEKPITETRRKQPAFQQPGSGQCIKCKRMRLNLEKKNKKFCQDQLVNKQALYTPYECDRLLIQNQMICKICQVGIRDSEYRHCLKCQGYFHLHCFDGGKYPSVCRVCHMFIRNQLQPIGRIKILVPLSEQGALRSPVFISKPRHYGYNIGLRAPKRLNIQQRKMYSWQLLYVIDSKSMRYSQSLIYSIKQPEAKRLVKEDYGLQNIGNHDFRAYQQYKKQPIGPFKFKVKPGVGYQVIADKDIVKHTILCEYIGQVVTKRQATVLCDDSLMELVCGGDSDTSLIITPRKVSNIARFINGVSKSAVQRANVQSLRLRVGDAAIVLLFARRNIAKGESLQYDYNGGGFEHFPTDGFV